MVIRVITRNKGKNKKKCNKGNKVIGVIRVIK